MKKATVMGSLVLDITMQPESKEKKMLAELIGQGKVTNLSGISFYPGGCVGNTGMALKKLGVPVTLCGNTGDDFPGRVLKTLISESGALPDINIYASFPTSVGIAITPAGMDKISFFLKGASQQYTSADASRMPADTDLFHFGYPPTMESLYSDGGEELEKLFRSVKSLGVTTSLDTALPAAGSAHSRVDWKPILKKVLKYVDIFVPSIEECLFMLDKEAYKNRVSQHPGEDIALIVSDDEIRSIADTFLEFGAKIVLLKLGMKGLYLKTATVLKNLGRAFGETAEPWEGKELRIFPVPVSEVVSTTGAGDTAIAGFLAAVLHGDTPETALSAAVYTASRCVMSKDTTSLIEGYEMIREKALKTKHNFSFNPDQTLWHYRAEADLYERNR